MISSARLLSRLSSRVRTGAGGCLYSTHEVVYKEYGNPQSVLKLQGTKSILGNAANLGSTDVAVKMLAAPINPSDLNMVEGVYGIKATFPAIGGNEGVGVVKKVGSGVKGLKEGDWVIPSSAGFGTWRSEAVADEKKFLKIPNNIPVPYAATLAVNPCTAYRMLHDFEALKPGDVIIQNGANSMVGLAVIQMAKKMGVKTINVVRSDRPEVDTTLRMLSSVGGDVNVTDKYLSQYGFKEIVQDLPPIKLGLNCVGGDVVADMVRALGPNSTLVTYGGMSRRPVTVPFEVLAYKQIKMKGFWISAWNETAPVAARTKMLEEIAGMISAGDLELLFEMHDFDDFDHALQTALEPFYLRKVVLNIDYPDRFKEHDAKDPSEYSIFQTETV